MLQSRQKPMKRNQGEISELKTGASKLKVIGENQKQIEYKRRKDHEFEDRSKGSLEHRKSVIGEKYGPRDSPK